MEVFAIKYVIDNWTDDPIYQECTETFCDEIKFKKRLTNLQDDWTIRDIKVYGGSIPRIE